VQKTQKTRNVQTYTDTFTNGKEMNNVLSAGRVTNWGIKPRNEAHGDEAL
jgi:hypothetical protein